MYGKESLSFEEVSTKIISEERSMKSEENTSSSSMVLTRSGANGKKIHAKNLPCWKCGMSGHLKRNCPSGVVSEKDYEASASNVSLVLGDDDDLI
jgi:hypothetical protein